MMRSITPRVLPPPPLCTPPPLPSKIPINPPFLIVSWELVGLLSFLKEKRTKKKKKEKKNKKTRTESGENRGVTNLIFFEEGAEYYRLYRLAWKTKKDGQWDPTPPFP
ncbi:hypothetical protein CEXT_5181 [Caerostris extrusa]|uniref:Uncharacterized protein n=1 Tax=Caerostris extrusa TaxID=172846 RepID=A0AAV4PI62_CAEEX|nr:hypothetical protein CEXT_5181 [Caerostris extrusa]